MGTWREYIEKLNIDWIGKKVIYNTKIYTVVFVDYNGIIHIDKPTENNSTTAVYEPYEAKKFIVK